MQETGELDVRRHSVIFLPPEEAGSEFSETIILAFEDVRRDMPRTNQDFEDLVFTLEFGTCTGSAAVFSCRI